MYTSHCYLDGSGVCMYYGCFKFNYLLVNSGKSLQKLRRLFLVHFGSVVSTTHAY